MQRLCGFTRSCISWELELARSYIFRGLFISPDVISIDELSSRFSLVQPIRLVSYMMGRGVAVGTNIFEDMDARLSERLKARYVGSVPGSFGFWEVYARSETAC